VNFRNKFFTLSLLLLLAFTIKAGAQITPDTTLKEPIPKEALAHADTVKMSDTIPYIKDSPFTPNPKKAGLYSALLPGMGQAYNRQYWKVPFIYAGIAVTGYFFIDNQTKYRDFRKAYIGRIDNDPTTTDEFTYTNEQIKQLQDSYKKFSDLTILFAGIGYTLQILDAVSSAHLKNFDVSPDISMRIQPALAPNYIGMGLVMNFK
jgi:hypothetical protein